MRSPLASAVVVVAAAVVALGGCDCGGALLISDSFSGGVADDSLHTYASGGRVGFNAFPVDGFDLDDISAIATDGSVAVDPDADFVKSGDHFVFGLLTNDAGKGSFSLVDQNENVLATRDVEVKDADALVLDLTAPRTAGVDLPAVDVTRLRILAGERAAFRSSLFAGDDELFALDNVSATSADVGFRNGVGCAEDSCSQSRNAVEFSVPADATDPIDVALAASGAVLTVTVVPTAAADVTAVVLDESDEFEGGKNVVAKVSAGDEPVFGAPVRWSVDDDVLVDDDNGVKTGDVLQFKPSSAEHAVTASFAGTDVDIAVSGEDFDVSAVTFACGAGPASSLPLVLCLLALRRRRRR